MKICKIAYYHQPLDGRIFYKEALSLKEQGNDVTLLLPLYQGKLYSNTQEIILNKNNETIIDGILIKAIRLKPIRLPIIGYFLTIFFYTKALVKNAIELNADVYHCHDHKIALHGFLKLIDKIKKSGGKAKFIFDVHEYYPGQIKDQYGKTLRYLYFKYWMRRMDKKAVQRIDQFIVVSEAPRIYYLSLNRFIKIDMISNYSSAKIFGFNKEKIVKRRQFTLCHEGNLSFDRGIKELVQIIIYMKEQNHPVHLKIIGSIPAIEQMWIKEQIKKYNLQDYIHWTGWVPYKQVGNEISECHLGLVTMRPLFNNIFSISNKFFNYLLYGLPVIAPKTPEMSRIVEEQQCGLTYQFENFDELLTKISKLFSDKVLYNQLSGNAFLCTKRYFNWEQAEKKLLEIYDKL